MTHGGCVLDVLLAADRDRVTVIDWKTSDGARDATDLDLLVDHDYSIQRQAYALAALLGGGRPDHVDVVHVLVVLDLHVVEHLEFRLNWVNDNDLDLLDIVVLQHVQHELQFQLIELDRLNWRLHILGWYLRHREHLGLDRLDWVHWLWKRAPVWWQSIGDSRLDQPCLQ